MNNISRNDENKLHEKKLFAKLKNLRYKNKIKALNNRM